MSTSPDSLLARISRAAPLRRWRKLFFDLHGWLGLNLGLLLFVICLSGTFATLSDEMDALVDPAHRVEPGDSGGTQYDWTAMMETLRRTFPDGTVRALYAPGASGRPTVAGTASLALVVVPGGETRKVYLDPFTGELRGHTGFFNVERFFRTFHRRLFDGPRGILVVTLTGFVLLASGVTGFGFYRGWLRQMLRLELRGTRRRRWSDLHKVAGIWGLPFTLLIAVTGIYYFVEVAYQRAGSYETLLPPPALPVDEEGLAAFGPQPELLPLGRYVELARQAYPELQVRTVRPAQAPGQAVYVDGQAGNALTRDRADQVHLHPFTGEVVDIQRTGELGVLPFLTDAVDPLHFGYVGGFGTQLAWFVLGLLLSFSILSGTYVWVVRSVGSRKRPSWLLRGAPVAVAVTLLYLGVVGSATVEGIRGYASPEAGMLTLGAVDVGPWEVRMDCEVPCHLSEGTAVAARFLGSGLPNYARAEVAVPGGSAAELRGPSRRPGAFVALPPGEVLLLRVTTRDGVVHEGRLTPSLAPGRGEAEAGRDPRSTEAAGRGAWPEAPAGVWWVILGFVALTVGSIVAWLGMVWRVARAR
jgi:uncharacterized iron-regulated membrane protein